MLEDDQQVAAGAQVKSFITHLYSLIKSFYLCFLFIQGAQLGKGGGSFISNLCIYVMNRSAVHAGAIMTVEKDSKNSKWITAYFNFVFSKVL